MCLLSERDHCYKKVVVNSFTNTLSTDAKKKIYDTQSFPPTMLTVRERRTWPVKEGDSVLFHYVQY